MKLHQFEYFHGIVLAKLLRKDIPVNLKLVETHTKDHWSSYIINDDFKLFITHSTSGRSVKQGGEGTSWTFTLNKNQISQITDPKRKSYVALVCGHKTVGNEDTAICLLSPDDVPKIIDGSKDQQSITVRKPKGKGKLRIFQDKYEKFLISQNAIDTLELKP